MAKEKIHVAEVVRHGEKIVVPETLELLQAAEILKRQHEDEDTVIEFNYDIPVFPWEGGLALQQALKDVFGFAQALGSWFGPPREMAVEVAFGKTVRVPWGKFSLPISKDEREFVMTSTSYADGRVIFAIGGQAKRKWLPKIEKLVERVKEIVASAPLYKGKAFTINFSTNIPEVKFLDQSGIDTSEIVFTKELTTLIDYNILTPLRHTEAVKAAGIPLKRGVLLAGAFGTGKSLLARGVSLEAVKNGWTFIYLKDAGELPTAIHFAKALQPAVIFAEDIDRQTAGERSEEMDEILNTLDGIDTKTTQIMVVLTTNYLENINQAMLRPGRLDVILKVTAPDAEAVTRLVKVYARGKLSPDADLTEAGKLLDGYTAAVIREVVERAKLMTINRTGSATAEMTAEDIIVSAKTIVQQQNLLKKPEAQPSSWHLGMIQAVAEKVTDTFKANGLGTMEAQVEEIHSAVT